MSELSNLGPGSDDLHDRARKRDEMLRQRMEQGGIPVDHGIREEITPEQREEWTERTRRHADEEDKIIDKMRGRTPPTTKSFSGLLKSLRAKYGIKAVTSDEGESFEDDEDRSEDPSWLPWEPDNSPKILNEEASKFFEKSYSMQVPIPHGNLSETNVPPVSWKPGVGAAKALSELASYFKALSDEKTFGQVHREKAMELLQKAVPYNLLFQGQQRTPSVHHSYYDSEGEPAFDPNPAGPPAPERTPTQEEIWNEIVEEAAKRGAVPVFDPTGPQIPYAEKYDSAVPAFIFDSEQDTYQEKSKDGQYKKKATDYDPEAQQYLDRLIAAQQQKQQVANRFMDTSEAYSRSQHDLDQQRRYGESYPGAEKETRESGEKQGSLRGDAWEEDYRSGDELDALEREVHNHYLGGGEYEGGYDLIENARRQVEDDPKEKALSVLNSFLKGFYNVGDTVERTDGDPNQRQPNTPVLSERPPLVGIVDSVLDRSHRNEAGQQRLTVSGINFPETHVNASSAMYSKVPPQ